MIEWAVAFPLGLAVGGLTLSACWGLFWLGISTTGFLRGSCTRKAWLNSLAMGGISLVLAGTLLWSVGEARRSSFSFQIGLFGVPLLLLGLAWRQAPDGRRAGAHLIEGMRHLADRLLGHRHECGGCSEEHRHEPS